MKGGIQPRDDWDYELPESKEEFNQLLNQLNNVLELIKKEKIIRFQKNLRQRLIVKKREKEMLEYESTD